MAASQRKKKQQQTKKKLLKHKQLINAPVYVHMFICTYMQMHREREKEKWKPLWKATGNAKKKAETHKTEKNRFKESFLKTKALNARPEYI